MDIGTAKPTAAERARVPHHLIDVADPAERYDVFRYQRDARAVLDGIAVRGRAVVVVGGVIAMELIGPLCVHFGLKLAGEAAPEPQPAPAATA